MIWLLGFITIWSFDMPIWYWVIGFLLAVIHELNKG